MTLAYARSLRLSNIDLSFSVSVCCAVWSPSIRCSDKRHTLGPYALLHGFSNSTITSPCHVALQRRPCIQLAIIISARCHDQIFEWTVSACRSYDDHGFSFSASFCSWCLYGFSGTISWSGFSVLLGSPRTRRLYRTTVLR